MSPEPDTPEQDGLTREAEVDRAAELLARYDPGSRRWDVQKQGNFWRACALLTDTSSSPGPVVAVVDDAFDTSLPALAEQTLVWPNGSGERTVHGTTVALLILEVAPHAQLLLYPVARGSKLDEQLAAHAVNDAATRGAAIVNLSMSRRRPLTEWFDIDALRAALLPSAHGVTFAIGRAMADTSFRQWLRVAPSSLGDAVLRGGAGAQVVAAVGNANGKLATPAVLPGVLGVGFMTEARSHAEGFETATPEAPDFAQSGFTDFSLRQPAHVLGSSFATPLLSGFCARACTRDELTSFVEAVRLAGQADELWRLTRVGQTRWDPTREGVIDEIFLRAVRAAPHQHQLSTTAVDPCAACALFMTQLYVDYGLFKLNWADLAGAEVLLRTVRGFAPTDPGAAAGLATAHAAMAATFDAADDASLIRKGELLTSARDHMGVAAGLAPENRILPLYVADYESGVRDPRGWVLRSDLSPEHPVAAPDRGLPTPRPSTSREGAP